MDSIFTKKNMELISKKELKDLLHANRLGKDILGEIFFQVFKLQKLNTIDTDKYKKDPQKLITEILTQLGIKLDISEIDIERIPKNEPFIIISNHPYNILDELILFETISKVRPDFKIVTNNMLHKIKAFESFFLSDKYFDSRKDKKQLNHIIEHIFSDKCIGVFPSGKSSEYNVNEKQITDNEWKNNYLKFIINCEIPIIPVYISSNNNNIISIISKIHPFLKNVQIPNEIYGNKDKKITIRIGNPISVEKINSFLTIKETGRYLRAKVYSLGNSLHVDSFYKKPFWSFKKHTEEIIEKINPTLIDKEIENLKKESLLFEISNYSVVSTTADKIPNTILEIGRLREITFREIGEGTQKNIDLDQYDIYYNHIIIWDNTKKCIVGSYRIGEGKEIIKKYGVKGMYIRSLFRIKPVFTSILEESLELGRSFIVKEYQRKTLPLFLLWKGIFYYLLKNNEYRYLIGPVSISNSFSKFSKSLIVSFVQSNYYDKTFAQYIKPRKKFIIPNKYMPDIKELSNEIDDDILKMDSVLNEIENDKKIPVLLKKYLSLNAKIIGFNVDPLFNNCLDGLLILDVFSIPQNIIESMSKDLGNEDSQASNISLPESLVDKKRSK